MPAGLQVLNDDDYLQIDGDFFNYVLWSKATITTNTTILDTSFRSVTLTGLSGYPIIAVASTAGAYAYVASFSGTTATIIVGAKGAAGTSVTYYVFCPPDQAADPGGFEVRNEDGDVVFSAYHRYMRVAGMFSGTPSSNATDTDSVTMASGKTYAVVTQRRGCANRMINQNPVPPGADYWSYNFFGYVKVVSNVITMTSANFQAVHLGVGTAPEVSIGTSGPIIDVTGY